jgi:Type VI secretion system/phage-baseplate injector OB domain
MTEGNSTRYYGKYRGTVLDNLDPEQRGRITAIVPDVQGLTPMTWALPCVPIAGKQQGVFHVPQIGAAVWIEFEQGDPEHPIWVGGFWGQALEVPTSALTPPPVPTGNNIVIQTTLGTTLAISDAPALPVESPLPAPAPVGTGGIALRSKSGAVIVVNDTGIYINNGQGASIEMIGTSVMINKVALVVT